MGRIESEVITLETTDKYGLRLPAGNENADVDDLNYNAEKIDELLQSAIIKDADSSNTIAQTDYFGMVKSDNVLKKVAFSKIVEKAKEIMGGVNTKTVRASNIAVPLSAWSQETSPTVADYPWKAEVTVSGIDATYKPSNLVSLTEGFMDLLYDFANTGTNKLILYASEKPTTAATIDSVDFTKVVS